MNQAPLQRPISPIKVLGISFTLFMLLLVCILFSLSTGTAEVNLGRVVELLAGKEKALDTAGLIIFKIRLPRILLAGLVGFSLSLGGVVFQALLRNPLADPFILGVSSGGAFGAVVGIILGLGFRLGIPAMAFGGSLLSVFMVMAVGRRDMGMESSTILLTGVIINAFFTAVIMFFISGAADENLHTMLFWLYGDLSQSYYAQSAIITPVVFCAFAVIYSLSRHLNIITAGEENALQLGVDVGKVKKISFVVVSLSVGLVVSFSGLIGFVGLVVPHLARMAWGSDHRLLLPVSAIGGAIFLIAADTLARTIISPDELPVGVITAFIGAPFFIYLLKTRGSKWSRS